MSFFLQHRNDDVRQLALQAGRYPDVDMNAELQQIDGWQRSRIKLPLWHRTEGVLYPVHLSMEQCSSERTARYKASIVEAGGRMTDLTAGFGVDATMMGQKFGHLTYVEQNEDLCRIARNNLPLLGVRDYDVVCGDATEVIGQLPPQDLIFIDPARRDANGGRVVGIGDCSPDVGQMQDILLEKAQTVLIKLSPMLDISMIERELKHVSEIHVVSADNECKEVLVMLRRGFDGCPKVVCANLKGDMTDDLFAFTHEEEMTAQCHYTSEVGKYVFEPNASVMKAGGFRCVAQKWQLSKLHPNSHLYTGNEDVKDFPGRRFEVEASSNLNKKELRQMLSGITQANITVRNFPMSVAELRKRLKLRDGGGLYILATTLSDDSRILLFTRKL